MKKYITLLSIILIITSCDIVEGPYITDSNAYVNPDKKVLIEDFTGHRCKYCPDAARELENIQGVYEDNVIGMAIHVSDNFAWTNPIEYSQYTYDFRTKWGDNWDETYGISADGLPAGMINRIGIPNNEHYLEVSEWAATVASELKKEVDFLIFIEADTNSINISLEIINNINNNYNLRVCLTESYIINWQTDGEEHIEDYEHNHVLRSVVFDESFSSNQNFNSGEIIEKSISINLTELQLENIDYSFNGAFNGNGNAGAWKAENLSVVAYIYNTSTMEIVQVEEAHLIN